MDCIFCKIVTGEAAASKVYEDDDVLAFMDIQPVHEGQVIVIPKQHIDRFSDIPDELASKIFLKAQNISKKILSVVDCERAGLVVHGYGVAHAHMIVIPLKGSGDITTSKMAAIENGEIVFSMKNMPIIPRETLEAVAVRLRSV